MPVPPPAVSQRLLATGVMGLALLLASCAGSRDAPVPPTVHAAFHDQNGEVNAPAWVAIQDGDGAWGPVTPAPEVAFTVRDPSGRYGLAYVREGAGEVLVQYATVAEQPTLDLCVFRPTFDTSSWTARIEGRHRGVGGPAPARSALFEGSSPVGAAWIMDDGTWHGVASPGVRTLVAWKGTLPERFIAKRDLRFEAGKTLRMDLDFEADGIPALRREIRLLGFLPGDGPAWASVFRAFPSGEDMASGTPEGDVVAYQAVPPGLGVPATYTFLGQPGAAIRFVGVHDAFGPHLPAPRSEHFGCESGGRRDRRSPPGLPPDLDAPGMERLHLGLDRPGPPLPESI